MLCADKGVGKSTLLISLCNCGGRVITDDLSLISESNGTILIHSSFPSVKLNSRQYALAKGIISSSIPVIKGSSKRNCMLMPEFFYEGNHKLDCIYILNAVGLEQPVYVHKLNRIDAFIALLKSVFCGITSSVDEMIGYQRLIRKMICNIEVYTVDIPHNLVLLPKVVDIITHYLER